MKDYRLPAAVTIPAAIGLVGVLWLLRRKSGSGDGTKKAHKAVPEEKAGVSELNNTIDEEIEHSQIGGVIISHQKIPETLVCHYSVSELESPGLSKSAASQVTLDLGKPGVESYRNLNDLQECDEFKTEIKSFGQIENVLSDSLCHNGQVNSSASTDLIEPEQINSLALSGVTSSDRGEIAIDAQRNVRDDLTATGVEDCAEGNGLSSSFISQNLQSSHDTTDLSQGDGLLSVSIAQDGQCDSLASLDTTQGGQCDGLMQSDTTQDGQCGGLTSDTAQDGQCDDLTSSDINQDGQCDGLIQSDTTQDGHCDVLTSSDTAQDNQCDGLTASDTAQDGQCDGLTASDTAQVGQCDGLTASDTAQDGQCDGLTASDTTQDGQCDGLTASDTAEDGQCDGLVSLDVQQHDQSNDLIVPEVQHDDGLVASDVQQDNHYDSVTSSNDQHDSQYDSLLSSDGQLESHSDSLSSSVQQDDQCDSMMSSYNALDSEFSSQASLDTAQFRQHVGPKDASVAEYGQGDGLTTSQKAYIEQQIISAMGDGLEEACRQLCKLLDQPESAVKRIPTESGATNDFARNVSSGTVTEHDHVKKSADSELKGVQNVDHMHEDDLELTGSDSEVAADVKLHAQIEDDLVCLETEATTQEPSGLDDTESLVSADSEPLEAADSELLESADVESFGNTVSLEPASNESLVSSSVEYLESANAAPLQSVNTESLESASTASLESANTVALESASNESLVSSSVEYLESANAAPLQSVNTESLESASTASLESANTVSLESANTVSLEPASNESLVSSSVEYLESANAAPLQSVNTESLESASTASLESASTASLESAKTVSLEPVNTVSLEPANIVSLDTANTESFVSSSIQYLEPADLEPLESASTASLESASTVSLESANTTSLESASTASLESANTSSLESANTASLESASTESLVSSSVEYLESSNPATSQSANTESVESAKTVLDFENASPVVVQEGDKSLQEMLTPKMPFSNSSPSAGSQSHVHTLHEDLPEGSPTRDMTQDDQHDKQLIMDSCISAASTSDAGAVDTSIKTTQGQSSSADKSIKSLPSEKMETRKSFSWLPKASSSSIDSFGPEEIEAIWGIEASMVNLDEELTFLDTDTVAVPVDGDSLVSLTGDLGSQQDVPAAAASMSCKDKLVVSASSRNQSDKSCDNVSEPNLNDGAVGKSTSPVCDNNSEGSNDSGRGGSEHDMVCQGGEVLVHFNFCMPSDLCGQFIGKQGKNINYLKTKSGAHVSLTSNAFMPEYQICQVVGTQAEVDDALSMIRRKFPLQDYPHLTMEPIDMSVPVPVQPESQVVYPEVMQLSLPEGVSVEVFVSAVVDAGQVFVQQPTHRSYMSLEKMNYFLNLVYSQDPNVPSVPLPLESGVICVCESEGFWYRAMIMSPVDENGEVQLKFVDYGGYVTLPVASLKQIRVDFMNLPFQAVECFMANITPNQNEKLFSDEATQALCDLTQGKLLQCQVVARTEYGIPYIHLYQVNPERNSAVLINRALVNRRLVRWIEIL